MAQKRRRKHRGTQAGTVRKRRSRPSRTQTRATGEQRRQERMNRPPTWRGSITRGLLAGGALFALLLIVGGNAGQAVTLALAALLVYIPAFHMVDSLLYRRRQHRQRAEREADS
jgi:Flp pilus assembly protein TadB